MALRNLRKSVLTASSSSEVTIFLLLFFRIISWIYTPLFIKHLCQDLVLTLVHDVQCVNNPIGLCFNTKNDMWTRHVHMSPLLVSGFGHGDPKSKWLLAQMKLIPRGMKLVPRGTLSRMPLEPCWPFRWHGTCVKMTRWVCLHSLPKHDVVGKMAAVMAGPSLWQL